MLRSLAFLALLISATLVTITIRSAPADGATDSSRIGASPRGAPEMSDGTFEVTRSGVSHPVAWVWVRDGTGGEVLETWLLFRPGTTSGWKFPGASNTSVGLTFGYRSVTEPASVAAFKAWAAGEYDAGLAVNPDLDFEVHEHVVTID